MCCGHSLDGLVNEGLNGRRALVPQSLCHASAPPHKQGVVEVVLETSLHTQTAAGQHHRFADSYRAEMHTNLQPCVLWLLRLPPPSEPDSLCWAAI